MGKEECLALGEAMEPVRGYIFDRSPPMGHPHPLGGRKHTLWQWQGVNRETWWCFHWILLLLSITMGCPAHILPHNHVWEIRPGRWHITTVNHIMFWSMVITTNTMIVNTLKNVQIMIMWIIASVCTSRTTNEVVWCATRLSENFIIKKLMIINRSSSRDLNEPPPTPLLYS